jgi:hypothetical protein
MKHFFISYSRVDSAFVLQLVRDLDKRDIHVWLDQLDIPPGVNWDNEIEKALDQCKSMIVVLSSVSAKSENLKNEVGAALERGKQIVPLVLAKGSVPLMINRLQREDFTGDYAQALEKLVHRLSGGSRSQSLRAISPEDVDRAAREAAARLAALPAAERESAAGIRHEANLQLLMSKLDKNGDGILTPDELRGVHGNSMPDSLSPVSAQPREVPRRGKRKLWLGLAAAAVCLMLVTTLALEDEDADPGQSDLTSPAQASGLEAPGVEPLPAMEEEVAPENEAEASVRRAAAAQRGQAQAAEPLSDPPLPESAKARARRRYREEPVVVHTGLPDEYEQAHEAPASAEATVTEQPSEHAPSDSHGEALQ